MLKEVQIPVRDGTTIAAAIHAPETSGRFPALLAASPYRYDNNVLPAGPQFLWRETGPVEFYVKQGHAYVNMDVRGAGIGREEVWHSAKYPSALILPPHE